MREGPAITELDWTLTPLEALARWPSVRAAMMLHSGRVHPRWARWSILTSPSVMFRHHHGRSTVTSADEQASSLAEVRLCHDPLADLDALLDATRLGADSETVPAQAAALRKQRCLPFVGGWIGSLSYELGRVIEPAVGRGRWDASADPWPLVELGWCPWALLFDHVESRWRLAGDLPADWQWSSATGRDDSFTCSEVHAATGRAEYLAAVERAIEYIRAGDIYQANIARRFEADVAGSTRGLARAAMERALPWYGACLELAPDRSAISMSPELFLEWDRRSGLMLTRPIKGTRPATSDVAELEGSIKDAAELAMIVDLMRNDLGRVCETGSVRVRQARSIESHPTVHHAAAEVAGRALRGTSVGAALRAIFPGGSITGAPKIRAMQVIDELEAHSRGPMYGAIGCISDNGLVALNMAIRTMWVAGRGEAAAWGRVDRGRIGYSAGCGIVVDSIPEDENLECLGKLEAFVAAIGAGSAAGVLRDMVGVSPQPSSGSAVANR